MKYDIKSKNKMYNNRLNKNNSNIENDSLNESLDYKYNTFRVFFRILEQFLPNN